MDAASSSAPQFHNNNQQQQRQSAAIALINFAINPQHFVEEDYYDLDSILATTANVACIFEQQAPLELFPLIGQKAPGKIPERGYRTNMPAWMLSAGIDNICQPVVPTAYSTVNRDVISAGSTAGKLEATRLVAKQRHFYTFGMFICSHLSTDQGRQIALTLLDAFTQRIGPIITRAVDITTKPRDLLDEAEKRIFWAVQRSERRQREWIRREHGHSQRRSTKRKFYGQQQRGNNNGGSAAVGHGH